jgi:hypothetical protein
MDKHYKPPQYQCDFINHLDSAGFFPTVNSLEQPRSSQLLSTSGLFFLYEDQRLVRIDEWKGEKVLCLQWYNDPLTKDQLDTIKGYCAPFYGLGQHKSFVSQKEKELLDRKCMLPPPVNELKAASPFLGNFVRLENDRVEIKALESYHG